MTTKNTFYTFLGIVILSTILSCGSQQNSFVEQSTDEISALEKKSIVQDLKDHQHLSIDHRIERYYHLKASQFEAYDFDMEEKLNLHGYDLLWAGKKKEALAIFQLVVDEFPESANAYDSLGEAHLALGNNEEALANYEKTLAMNPNNFFAEDQIERIKFPNKEQLTPQEKFALVLPKESYLADLDQLSSDLKTKHPFVFKFTPEAKFDALVNETKKQINDETTVAEYLWLCHKIVAAVNCSHTSIGEFWVAREMLPDSLRFPLQVQYLQNKLYVVGNEENRGLISVGDEILSINGTPVPELMSDIFQHIVSQGTIESTKRMTFNTWANVLIPYAQRFPSDYSITTTHSNQESIRLRPNPNTKELFDHPGIEHCNDELCCTLYEEQKTAFLRISSFNYYDWNRFSEFQAFMDEKFALMDDQHIEKLIIDLRGNGGGAPEASIHLLRYLMPKEFEYFGEDSGYELARGRYTPFENAFDGEVFYLIDGYGQSTTGHFMGMVRNHKLGTIVGEELGSNHFCTGGQQRCRSKNTKIEYAIAMGASFLKVDESDDAKGILPDVKVEQRIEDYLDKRDPVKAKAFEMAGVPKSAWYVPPIEGVLSSQKNWGEELFRLPTSFAPELNYHGFEELRFAPGWSDADHENFWTYLFIWSFDPLEVNEEKINTDLEHYFDGLMNIKGREGAIEEIRTQSNLSKFKDGFRGELVLFDGFHTLAQVKLYVDVKNTYCEDGKRQVLRFEFSPKPFDHPVRAPLNDFLYLTPCIDC
jgi:C-terminal processing protease CtpA/Prc